MKKISLILLSLILITVLPAVAQDINVGSVTYYCEGATVSEAEDGVAKVEITQSKGYAAQKVFMEKGGAYSISADVKMENGNEILQFVVDTGEGIADSVDVGTLVGSEYTQLSGTYIYSGEAKSTQAKVYIRVGSGAKKATYYIKDFKIATDTERGQFFADVEKTDKYYEYIYRLTKDGIISGKPGGIYAPDAEITRAEFVTLLTKGSGLSSASYGGEFSDVAEGAWYSAVAATALANNLEDYSDKFEPDGNVQVSKALDMIRKIYPEADIAAEGEALDRKNAARLIFKMREQANRTSYYVNPETGDDGNDGSEENPFKTVNKAKEVMASASRGMENDLYVYLGGGDYFTYEPIKFTNADSGKNGFRIYYKNLPGETPVMQAGVPVSGWEIHDAEKNIYKAPANGSESRQLYVNGTRAVRARSEGELTNASLYADGVECDNTEIANFAEPAELELAFINKWILLRGLVEDVSINSKGRCEIKVDREYWQKNQTGNENIKITLPPAWYENAYELLDTPGEFYLSIKEDMFYYMPREGEDINEIKAYSGTDTNIINIISDGAANPLKNVTFDGISFSGNTWLEPSEIGFDDVQNSYVANFTRAIYGERLENVDIINCRFENLGGEGIKLIRGVKNTNITGNRFYDISGHAMWIGEFDEAIPSDERLWNENIKISNNYIEKAGCEYMSAVPLTAGYLKDSEITHNEIFDCPYSGMHIGWGWGSVTESNTINMLIAYNYIHEVMQTLHDGGAIYCLGGTGGSLENPNRLYRNYIVNQYSATSVLYTDEGSNYWRVHENVQDMTDSMDSWEPQYGSTWYFTCHDNIYEDNYVMLDKFQNGGTRCTYRNTKVYPDANWDTEPLAIMQNAGLEPQYAHLSPSGSDRQLRKIVMTNEPDIKIGEKISLNVRGITKAGDFVDLSGVSIKYDIDNPEVATVDANGVITGIKQGKTTVAAQVTVGDKVMTKETTVYVDDEFAEIVPLVNFRPSIVVGEMKTGYGVMGKSLLGRTVELDEVTLSSTNPDALEVLSDGTINAKQRGEAAVVVTARAKNVEITKEFTMNVINYAEPDVPEYTPISTKDIFSKVSDWEIRKGSSVTAKGANTLYFATPAGQVTYKKQKFENEIFKFDLSIGGAKNWPAITMRNRSITDDYLTNCYMIDFAGSAIEVQRWNEGERTAIFCDLQNTRVGMQVPKNVTGGEIEVGTITEENGVRIIFKVDGETIINYLDTDENRITEPGYLGIMTESSNFTITGK